MLINTIQGLQMSDKIHRDLMQTYNATSFQTLIKLRLAAAMPFIFNGLKICSTLALIGAIVAEFFGSPIKGIGFQDFNGSWQVCVRHGLGRDNNSGNNRVVVLWWDCFIGKGVTFWHPSQRG